MNNQQEYLKEIDAVFGIEYNTTETLIDSLKKTTVPRVWVDILVFVRKQARFYNVSYRKGDEEAKKKVERIVDKAKWVGEFLVPFLFTKIPVQFRDYIFDGVIRREKEEKHMEELRKKSLEETKPGDKVAQLEFMGDKVTTKRFTVPDPLGEKDLIREFDSSDEE